MCACDSIRKGGKGQDSCLKVNQSLRNPSPTPQTNNGGDQTTLGGDPARDNGNHLTLSKHIPQLGTQASGLWGQKGCQWLHLETQDVFIALSQRKKQEKARKRGAGLLRRGFGGEMAVLGGGDCGGVGLPTPLRFSCFSSKMELEI